MEVGLRQGCALSPTLFVIFMDRITRRVGGGVGIRIGELRVASLLFADDVFFWHHQSETFSSHWILSQ